MTPAAVAAGAPRVEERASGAAAAAVLRICETGPGAPAAPPDHVSRVRRALVALREPMSVEHREDSVPAAVAVLGFDRVVYARLCGADWRSVGVRGGSEARDVPATMVRYVDNTVPFRPDSYRTIQAAVAASGQDDTVKVTAGSDRLNFRPQAGSGPVAVETDRAA